MGSVYQEMQDQVDSLDSQAGMELQVYRVNVDMMVYQGCQDLEGSQDLQDNPDLLENAEFLEWMGNVVMMVCLAWLVSVVIKADQGHQERLES